MSNQEVVTYIRENIAAGMEPEEICETLMMRCLAPDCQMAGLGCDNMTVVIVGLLNGGTYEELSAKCQIPRVVDDTKDEEEDEGWEVKQVKEEPAEEKNTVEITEIDQNTGLFVFWFVFYFEFKVSQYWFIQNDNLCSLYMWLFDQYFLRKCTYVL